MIYLIVILISIMIKNLFQKMLKNRKKKINNTKTQIYKIIRMNKKKF
jgi:hypothetical protein